MPAGTPAPAGARRQSPATRKSDAVGLSAHHRGLVRRRRWPVRRPRPRPQRFPIALARLVFRPPTRYLSGPRLGGTSATSWHELHVRDLGLVADSLHEDAHPPCVRIRLRRTGIRCPDGHRYQYLCGVARLRLQPGLGNRADRGRFGLLEHFDERLRPLGEVVVEHPRRPVQNTLHISVGMLPVDRRQVQRTLPRHLDKLTSLELCLMRLVGTKSEPSAQRPQRNDDGQTEQCRAPRLRHGFLGASDRSAIGIVYRGFGCAVLAIGIVYRGFGCAVLAIDIFVVYVFSYGHFGIGHRRHVFSFLVVRWGWHRWCQLPGGSSSDCHVLSFGAVWARSDWVY